MQSNPPQWLADIGAEIDPLVNKHHARIADMVDRWVSRQQKLGSLRSDGPLPFREDRQLTIEDQYAIVAAVHQVTMPGFGGKWGEDQPVFDYDDENW